MRAIVAVAALLPACAPLRTAVMDAAMSGAFRAPKLELESPNGLTLLAGDFHCHVSPPDSPGHVARDLTRTVEIAEREGLDFVVLTPHVRARFFQDARDRETVLAAHRAIRGELDALRSPVLFSLGFEYSDREYGHAGTAFGDIGAALERVSLDEGRADPGRFVDAWAATGGLVFVNHPLLTPVNFVIPIQWWNLSWRPLARGGPFPADIERIRTGAHGYEAYNLAVAHLRDRVLLGEEHRSTLGTLEVIDRQILSERRRITPVAGSDSHGHFLRATTFVIARERSLEAIREGVLLGRTCVRSPEACTLVARAPGGPRVGIGGALDGVREVEVAIVAPPRGAAVLDAEIYVSGREVVRVVGRRVKLEVAGGECTLVRARVGDAYSAPIYVNCPFAMRPPT